MSPRQAVLAVICRFPSVSVPVLSKIIWVARASVSRVRPRLIRKPLWARALVALLEAMGVASERAQGQVATSTVSVIQNASPNHSAPPQAKKPVTVEPQHDGNKNLCRSSPRPGVPAGACGQCSSRLSVPSVLSLALRVTRMMSEPSALMLPLGRSRPGFGQGDGLAGRRWCLADVAAAFQKRGSHQQQRFLRV